jgi:hypothetical protein
MIFKQLKKKFSIISFVPFDIIVVQCKAYRHPQSNLQQDEN